VSQILNSLKAEWNLAKGGAPTRVPLYHQLYSVLKDSILNGTISYDSQMPTEQQLAVTFNMSRITAKRAMDELAAEKLIARFRGKGSHVTYRYTPKEIRERLGLRDRDTVHKLVRVSSNEEGEPYAYYLSWTIGITKGYTKKYLEKTLRLDVIRENGIKLTKIEQVISAESASVKMSADLDVEQGAALLSIRREPYNENGDIVDVLDCLYNPERYQYSMILSLD
jgi:GntR family transcriptional regulator